MLPMALVAQYMGKGLHGCRVLLSTLAAPGRGKKLPGDRVKAAVHLMLTRVESCLQTLNGMNWLRGLAKYSFADAWLWVRDNRHSIFIALCSGEKEQGIKTNIAKPFRRYNKPQSELHGKPERKYGRGKIQRKPLVMNLVQWQQINRTGRKNCSTPRSLVIPREKEDGNRNEGRVFHLRKPP